jgi:hypothetical protein
MKSRIKAMIIMPEGEAIFHQQAIEVEIEDEAAGEYLIIRQCGDHIKPGEISIDHTEWPILKKTIDAMMKNISEWEIK